VSRGCGKRDRQAGISLVELVVTMAVGSIVLLALGTTFTGSLRTSGEATNRISNTAELRLGLDTVARRLRVAVPPRTGGVAVVEAKPRSVRFYASLSTPGDTGDKPPVLVEYAITPTCLQEKLTTPTGTSELNWSWSPGASTSTTCLARGAVNADGSALFAFYATGNLTATALGDATGVAAGDLAKIASVAVHGSVKASATSTTPSTSARTRVTLTNLLSA
jgi:Tfp pilus assembly protein PilW